MDVMSKEKRHKVMSHIRSKDTSIEVKLRKALWHKGYRYRKNYKGLPGRPDIVLTKQKIVIFCDGDFFHGKDWYTILRPKIQRGSNPEFWKKKIARNIERDNEINKTLAYLGWTVIRFWECDINKDVNECVSVIEECIFDAMLGRNV